MATFIEDTFIEDPLQEKVTQIEKQGLVPTIKGGFGVIRSGNSGKFRSAKDDTLVELRLEDKFVEQDDKGRGNNTSGAPAENNADVVIVSGNSQGNSYEDYRNRQRDVDYHIDGDNCAGSCCNKVGDKKGTDIDKEGGNIDNSNSCKRFERVLTEPAIARINIEALDLDALKRKRGVKGLNDTYELSSPIHSNNKCLTFIGEGIDTGRKVVVKQYRDERFFKHELVISGILDPKAEHDSILLADEFIENDRGQFSVLRYVQGGDLHQFIESYGRLSPLECKAIFPAICDALDYMHGKGVIHRDIKAANVLLEGVSKESFSEDSHDDSPDLTREMREMLLSGIVSPRVIDYDIAWHRFVADPVPVGAVCGTISYMSPQVYEGEIDPRNDIFAAGATLYFMLTNKHPFDIDGTENALMAYKKMLEMTVSNPSEETPDVTQKLAEVVMTALAKTHEERYQSARELKSAFLDAMEDYS